ncbi:MAG TPA: hypothetical protein PKJ52_01150 [Rectinema sp.]|nr:hypothetical protein [Rectinema sp.]
MNETITELEEMLPNDAAQVELDERQEPTSKFYPFDDDYEFGTDHLYHESCDCPACDH